MKMMRKIQTRGDVFLIRLSSHSLIFSSARLGVELLGNVERAGKPGALHTEHRKNGRRSESEHVDECSEKDFIAKSHQMIRDNEQQEETYKITTTSNTQAMMGTENTSNQNMGLHNTSNDEQYCHNVSTP
jgi:hypothetical protein